MLPTVVTALLAGSGPKCAARPQLGVEPLVDQPRLHPDRLGLDADHAPQELGEIEHQARPQRFAGHAAAGAAGVHGMRFSAAYCTQATTSAVERGRTTASGRIS